MTRRVPILLCVLAVFALAAALLAGGAVAGGRPFTTEMVGEVERPTPGDPDGTGTAHFTLNQGLNEVCFELEVSGIAEATAAHIHVGPAGAAGPIVVGLTPPTEEGRSSGCVADVDPELIKAIRQDPEAYYVNVHNAEFPGGAVRGQLSK